jgi:hypothetical protein
MMTGTDLDSPHPVVPDVYGRLAVNCVLLNGIFNEADKRGRVLSSAPFKHPAAQLACATRSLESLPNRLNTSEICFNHENMVQVLFCSLELFVTRHQYLMATLNQSHTILQRDTQLCGVQRNLPLASVYWQRGNRNLFLNIPMGSTVPRQYVTVA